jgi:hypothetical protein
VTQEVRVSSIASATEYTDDVQAVYEAGFGAALGIYEPLVVMAAGVPRILSGSFKKGCTVTSAAVSVRRTGIYISYKATVANKLAATATSKSAGLSKDADGIKSLIQGIIIANEALKKTVAVPAEGSLFIKKAAIKDMADASEPTTTASSSKQEENETSEETHGQVSLAITVAAICMALMALALFGGIVYRRMNAPKDNTAHTKVKVNQSDISAEDEEAVLVSGTSVKATV